ncbi:MAG: response regulator [Alphaproteobacteria bacterium]
MAPTDKDLHKRLLATFAVEADEHIRALSSGLIELEKAPPAEAQRKIIERIFREVHSLKGAARVVNLDDVQSISHALESVFAALKRGTVACTPELLDLLHHAASVLKGTTAASSGTGASEQRSEVLALVGRLDAVSKGALARGSLEADAPKSAQEGGPPAASGADKAATEAAVATAAGAAAATVRIAVSRLDSLLRQAEELISAKLTAEQRVTDARELASELAAHVKARQVSRRQAAAARSGLRKSEGGQSRRRVDDDVRRFLDAATDDERALQSLVGKATALTTSAARDQRTLAKMVDSLLEDAKKALMVPVSALLEPFPGLVRDLARAQGKEVDLVIRGEDLEIDRRIQEEMKDPLLHLVRNCIDHGIEPVAERAARGKPRRGTIWIVISQREAGKARIAIGDDGAGIDAARVRAAAEKSGAVTSKEAETLDERAITQFIFRSGVSTSPILTDISGRGLGLAIVQEKVERLGGKLSLETVLGRGTTFRATLPMTLAAFRGVVVRADRGTFILPINNVERVARVSAADVRSVENRDTVRINGGTLSLVRLRDALGLPAPSADESDAQRQSVVVLASAGERIAFAVDAIVGEQEVLVKGLGNQLSRVRNVAGASVLGSGMLAPVLNVRDLMISASRARRSAAEAAVPAEAARQKSVLVAEDSITARTLLKNILESAGYRVRTAVDGIEAWTALKSEAFDLVVSDVEMPRMDGFGLTSRIREDKRLSELPVVLVTALESREDRERGIDAGADAYIAKSSFDQSNLLDVIGRLI